MKIFTFQGWKASALSDKASTAYIKKTEYFIDRFQELLKPKKEIEFNDYVSIGGLLELSRQYTTMPTGVRELSATDLKDSIIRLLDKHGTLLTYKDAIPIKEFKYALSLMYLIKELNNAKYVEKLFVTLSHSNTFIGIIRTIKHVLKRGISDCPEGELFSILDDLMFLLIEYLEYRGNTLSEIYRYINQQRIVHSGEKLFEKVIEYLRKLGSKDITSLTSLNCRIELNCRLEHKDLLISYTERLLDSMAKQKRLTGITAPAIEGTDNLTITFEFQLYIIDDKYIERLVMGLYDKYNVLFERTKNQNIGVSIFRQQRSKYVAFLKHEQKQITDTLHVKYFDYFWSATTYQNLNDNLYNEIFRINDWITLVNKTSERQLSFNALWSIMEFMLIDSVHDNKIETICSNFIPYMGLFYFRKVLKTYFKKLLVLYDKDQNKSQTELVSWVDSSLTSKLSIDSKKISFADAFCIFVFHEKLKGKWWDGINFNFASTSFIDIQTERIHKFLNDPTKALERFDSIVKSDLRQMYRLRNMLTHSGVNDNILLDNTYDRLKYYVQTLLNAVAYGWINSGAELSSVFDFNDFKRVDWKAYKSQCKSIKKLANTDITNTLLLVNYEGITLIPPNRFSFLKSLERS